MKRLYPLRRTSTEMAFRDLRKEGWSRSGTTRPMVQVRPVMSERAAKLADNSAPSSASARAARLLADVGMVA